MTEGSSRVRRFAGRFGGDALRCDPDPVGHLALAFQRQRAAMRTNLSASLAGQLVPRTS